MRRISWIGLLLMASAAYTIYWNVFAHHFPIEPKQLVGMVAMFGLGAFLFGSSVSGRSGTLAKWPENLKNPDYYFAHIVRVMKIGERYYPLPERVEDTPIKGKFMVVEHEYESGSYSEYRFTPDPPSVSPVVTTRDVARSYPYPDPDNYQI